MSYHFEEAVRGEVTPMLQADQPANIYRQMLDMVEKPLLEEAMKTTLNNQSKTAAILGINRATLRTKLKRHNLL